MSSECHTDSVNPTSHLYLISLKLKWLIPPRPPPRSAPPPPSPFIFASLPLFTFFLIPFYLAPLLALSWRPVVKCKHDWALSQRGSTPIRSSSALVLQSRSSCWYLQGNGEVHSKIRTQPLENVTTTFMEETAEKSEEDQVVFRRRWQRTGVICITFTSWNLCSTVDFYGNCWTAADLGAGIAQ